MALFKKLFGKETCVICGSEVGALKRKRLADGVLCKECAKKLSEWFTGYEDATTEQIKAQLTRREANQQALARGTFHSTDLFGEHDIILVDRQAGSFCALKCPSEEGLFGARRKVAGIDDVIDLNPDILSLRAITGVDIEIKEKRDEQTYTENDREMSYNPPRWKYAYEFRLVITVDDPYIKKMTVRLDDGPIRILNEGDRLSVYTYQSMTDAVVAGLTNALPGNDPNLRLRSEVYTEQMLREEAARFGSHSWNTADLPEFCYGFRCTRQNWNDIQRYGRCTRMALEARAALLQG